MEAALLILILGVNLTLWTLVGGARLAGERLRGGPDPPPASGRHHRSGHRHRLRPRQRQWRGLSPSGVAVLVAAHNEQPVIAATLDTALAQVPAQQVHVVADGCHDATAAIARARGVNVLELDPGRGKAGAIEAGLAHFRLADRFAVLLIADADTQLDPHYLRRGLPMLDRPGVVALAGYAKSRWRPQELPPVGRYLVSYRTRLYAVMQWIRYGQTWRWTCVTPIVPGFASMYRTEILDAMNLNPPGLVIEDFNMTFEIHHRRLGKITFRPGVHATTQDPANLRDYYRQVLRWHVGFWQTIRLHGLWPSGFSAALVLFTAEILFASVGIVLLFAWLATVAVLALATEDGVAADWVAGLLGQTDTFLTFTNLLLFLALPDYLLTCATAAALRRPSLLLYGVGFLGLRFVDATAILLAIPLAWRRGVTGRWTSPTRRPVASAGTWPGNDEEAPS